MVLLEEGDWTRWPPEVPCSLNNLVIHHSISFPKTWTKSPIVEPKIRRLKSSWPKCQIFHERTHRTALHQHGKKNIIQITKHEQSVSSSLNWKALRYFTKTRVSSMVAKFQWWHFCSDRYFATQSWKPSRILHSQLVLLYKCHFTKLTVNPMSSPARNWPEVFTVSVMVNYETVTKKTHQE